MHKILFLFILLVLASCSETKSTPSEQVTAYYEGFNNSDYHQIKSTIADSLTLIEGDFTMPFTPESFYRQFQWDSVFKPDYKVVNLENEGEQVVATVAVQSLRFAFLKNNPLTCSHRFSFKAGSIHKIEMVDCPDANWAVWQEERDSLVQWVKGNHPELDGFVNDLSRQGAINYLKAIELYTMRQVEVTQ